MDTNNKDVTDVTVFAFQNLHPVINFLSTYPLKTISSVKPTNIKVLS